MIYGDAFKSLLAKCLQEIIQEQNKTSIRELKALFIEKQALELDQQEHKTLYLRIWGWVTNLYKSELLDRELAPSKKNVSSYSYYPTEKLVFIHVEPRREQQTTAL